MKITADTNILVRILMEDDQEQADAAKALFKAATLIAVPAVVLCELWWVLKKSYHRSDTEIIGAIKAIVDAEGVVTDTAAVVAGLNTILQSGDFADGVIAHQGARLGGTTFASFDRNAVKTRRKVQGKAGYPADLIKSRSRSEAGQ